MDINWYAIVGLLLKLIGIVGLLLFVTPKQYRELHRPLNEFTPLRWILFLMVTTYLAFTFFSVFYSVSRLETPSVTSLQNITTVSFNIGSLLFSTAFILVYNYDAVKKFLARNK